VPHLHLEGEADRFLAFRVGYHRQLVTFANP